MTQFSTRRFLIEGTVIVVSILLAFGIDAGWDSYQAAREEQAVLQDLHRDFSQSVAALRDFNIPVVAAVQSATAELAWRSSGLSEPLPDNTPFNGWEEVATDYFLPVAERWASDEARRAEVQDSLLGISISGPLQFEPRLPTLDALLAGQGLTSLRSRELRAALAGFPARLAVLREMEAAMTRSLLDSYRPLIWRAANATLAEFTTLGWFIADQTQRPQFLDVHTVEIEFSRELVNVMAHRVGQADGVRQVAENLAYEMDEIVRLIEDQLRE
jgi:hypothetical protein